MTNPARAVLPLILVACSLTGWAEEKVAAPNADSIPWGIASSSSSIRNHSAWFPKMAAAGIPWARMFPEWRNVEPVEGKWKWDSLDAMLKTAAEQKIEINAILMGSTPWLKGGIHAFPIQTLPEWSAFVAAVVERYKNQIHYWEVWNEGNAGFNDDHNSTADYAGLVAATYAAAKKADPNAQIGMTVASYDAPYLNQACIALAKAGQANNFDYLCIHPYEVVDSILDPNGELPFLWMSRLLRDMLKANAPERANADIWISEVGKRVEKRNGAAITEADSAKSLVKIYTMALAQGIKRTLWFEAQDPVGEDQGFGLLNRDGSPRASYGTFKIMTGLLGATPKYLGWLALGAGGRGYGFVFQGATGPVLAAWMPAGETDKTVTFAGDVQVIDVLSGAAAPLKTGEPFPLSETPVFATGLPADQIALASANAAKNFPWGGDFSAAAAVGIQLGAPNGSSGVFPVGQKSIQAHTFPDGSTGIKIDANQTMSFFVHPSFADSNTSEYYVRLTLRRIGAGNVGMNFNYEVADSKGRSPYKSSGEWYSLPDGAEWQTQTWHLTGACLSKMWGYDFNFRPEKSVPFVIGKVEVGKAPF